MFYIILDFSKINYKIINEYDATFIDSIYV